MDLPDEDVMRTMLSLSLRRIACTDASVPADRDTAIARILSEIMARWFKRSIDSLNRDELVELTLLRRLLRAEAQEAGALAQLFRRADAVLDLRDEVLRHERLRAAYDRDMKALHETRRLWEASRGRASGMSLTETLRRLDAVDVDLWHRVVVEHDPDVRADRRAAGWCARQPECDRATVAHYLAQIVERGTLAAASRDGDVETLETLRQILANWGDGLYRTAELALEPGERFAAAGKGLSALLDRIALETGEKRWADPCGLFLAHGGRQPRARDHWDLARGRLLRAPNPEDYRMDHLS